MKSDPIKEVIMKKALILILLFVLPFSSCKSKSEWMIGDSMNEFYKKSTPYIALNSLYAFKINDNYLIVIDNDGRAEKIVEFSANRKSNYVCGLELVQSESIKQYVGINVDELKEKLGQPHTDIGSGFYIPSYVTENGYLLSFEIENNIVFEVLKRDLLFNELVERESN